MPLSAQEKHCIDLTCQHLSATLGSLWRVEQYLDDLYPSESTPEVIVGNGTITAAIEVKRLAWDSEFQEYFESYLSLERNLVPSCGGRYTLFPPLDFSLPMDLKLRRHVKREIERVAPTLAVGELGAIRIPCNADIELICKSGQPYIYCYHADSNSDLLRPLLERIEGQFFLVDGGLYEHSFVTGESREAFYEAVAAACRQCQGDAPVTASWDEEWKLVRHEDGEDGVSVVAGINRTELSPMRSLVAECVHTEVEKARKKLVQRRWANDHILVLVLEASFFAPARLVADVVASLAREKLGEIELILLVDEDRIMQCWPPASTVMRRDTRVRIGRRVLQVSVRSKGTAKSQNLDTTSPDGNAPTPRATARRARATSGDSWTPSLHPSKLR